MFRFPLLLSICCGLWFQPVFAQIQLNASDLPVPGEIWSATGSSQDTVPSPSFGASQTWNYANVPTLPFFQNILFKNNSQNLFPPSNLVGVSGFEDDSSFVGFEKRPNGMFLKGTRSQSQSFLVKEEYTPARAFIPFNLNLGQESTVTGKSIVTSQSVGGEGSLFVSRGQYTQTHRLVGYGNISTPLLSNVPALLFLEKWVTRDSTFSSFNGGDLEFQGFSVDTYWSLIFLKKGPGVPVAYFDYDSASNITEGPVFYSTSTNTAAEPLWQQDRMGVYPNPASGSAQGWVTVEEPAEVVVFSPTGQKVLELQVPPNRPTPLPLPSDQKGVFFIEMKGKSGSLIKRQKWVRN
jgi:hypothetical protein